MTAHARVVEVRSARRIHPWVIVAAGCLLLGLLALCPFLCWQTINAVPPFQPRFGPFPEPNGYIVASRAWAGVPEDGALAQLQLKAPRVPREAALESLRPAAARVRRAFGLAWRVTEPSKDDGSASDTLAQCAQVFAAESRVAAAHGHYGAALGCALDAIELGGNIARGGGQSERGTGQSCQMAGLEEVERLYPHLPPAGLRQHLRRVRRLRQSWPTIAESLDVERQVQMARCAESLRTLGKQSLWQQLDATETELGSRNSGWMNPAPSPNKPWAHRWEVWHEALTPRAAVLQDLDRFYRELMIASSRPAPKGVPVPELRTLWAREFASTWFTGQYRGEWARHNLALVETALAVRLFQLGRGRWPQRLEEIPHEWLPVVPVDVWGQPIAYRLKRGEPVIYSIGADAKDDGGRAVAPSSFVHGGRGDLVFGKLADSHWRTAR
jgi:hypothetical protein